MDALSDRDYPVVSVVNLFFAAVVVNLLTDLPPGSSRRLGGHATRAVNPLPTDRRQAVRGTTPLTSG